MSLPCPRAELHLDQEHVDELVRRAPDADRPLVLTAHRIVLEDAVVHDRDVVLVADTIEAGRGRGTITLVRTGAAAPARRLVCGSVEPPIPPQGEPPGAATAGPSLTVICREVRSGSGCSIGQHGGKGMQGPREKRSICQMSPPGPNNPGFNLTDPVAQAHQGPPGGPGLPGGAGGRGGRVTVCYVDGTPPAGADWHGLGGRGGEGGGGGEGGRGVGIGPDAGPGDDGPAGGRGDDGEDVDGTIVHLSTMAALAPATDDELEALLIASH